MTEFADDELLARIDRAFDEVSPVPPHLSAVARAAFGWRQVDATLAELLFDSAHDDLAGVRGAASSRRSFRFGTDDTVVRVHLTDDSLVLMIEPPLSVECRIATERDVAAHRTDEFGELVVSAPDIPMRIELDLPSGTIHTPWITS